MQTLFTNIAISFEPDYNTVGSYGYALEENKYTRRPLRDSDEW